MTTRNNVVYVYRNESNQPDFKEATAPGCFDDVLAFVKNLAATTAGFMMGQVLADDGKVLATVAKDAVHMNRA